MRAAETSLQSPRVQRPSANLQSPAGPVACYGVCCELHGQCQRYANVEGEPRRDTIARCATFSLFIVRKTAGHAA